jgi:hypothetical protein
MLLLERTMFLPERMTVVPGGGQMVLDVQALHMRSFPLERPTVSPPLGAGFFPCALSDVIVSERGPLQVPYQQAMDGGHPKGPWLGRVSSKLSST